MTDEYAHPIGQTSKQLVESAVDLQRQAEKAEAAGDKETADRLNGEAAQHLHVANTLDRADEVYGIRNQNK
jgi:hypothetical protein